MDGCLHSHSHPSCWISVKKSFYETVMRCSYYIVKRLFAFSLLFICPFEFVTVSLQVLYMLAKGTSSQSSISFVLHVMLVTVGSNNSLIPRLILIDYYPG